MGRRRSFVRSIERAGRRAIPFTRLVGSTVGMGLALAASAVGAQTPTTEEKDQKDDLALPGVDVRAPRRHYKIDESGLFKLPDAVKDTPQSITIVPEELMRQQAVTSLRDALRNVSGISLAAGEGGAQGDSLTLRGFSARNDFFLDGVRDQGSYTRDTFNLGAVEVLKGPSSVMFGRGSTGGAINQVSKTPYGAPGYSASLSAGNGPFLRGTADINQPLSPGAAVRLNLMGEQTEVVGRDEVEVKRWGVAPSVTLGLNGPTRLTLSYLFQQENNIPDDGVPFLFGEPAPVPRETFYGLPHADFERTNVHIATLRLEHVFNDDVRLRNTLRYAVYQRDHSITAPRIAGNPAPGTPLSAITVNRGRPTRDREDTILTNQTDVIVKFDTWRFNHTLVAGLELARETAESTTFTIGNTPTATLLNPNPFPDLSAVTRTRNQITDTTAYSVGLYAVDEMALTPQWKIIGGLRWDRFQSDFTQRTVATGARLELERTDSMVSPRAALVFQPTAAQTYYFSYGTSFNPSAEALTLAANNVNADPEESRTFELGAKWELLRNALSFRTALFQIDKTNARTADPVLGVMVLEGEQRVRGFELEAIGRILPRWQVFAGYTYLDSRAVEALEVGVEGKRLANVPEHSASLWTTYDIGERWQVGGGLVYVGERFANNTNTNRVPGYVRGDATVAFRPLRQIELRLNVVNISDEKYYDSVYQAHVVPGAGRTFILTGTFTY
jgi:catecholate siderophore receptor